jgi:hypothetical protein
MSWIVWLIIGVVVGWHWPQPAWAKPWTDRLKAMWQK